MLFKMFYDYTQYCSWIHFNYKIKKFLSYLSSAILISQLVLFQNGCSPFSIDPNSMPSIEEGNSAVAQMNLELSRNIFQVIAESKKSTVKDKVKAFQNLAVQDWRFYQDINSARQKLYKADSIGIDRTGSWRLLSRIDCEAGNYSEAQAAVRKAEELAEKDEDFKNAKIAFARATHDQAIQIFKQGLPINVNLLSEALKELKNILQKEPGEPSASELLLGISLLLNNGPEAMFAWRSYFWITTKDS